MFFGNSSASLLIGGHGGEASEPSTELASATSFLSRANGLVSEDDNAAKP